ncbi:MAG: hypothetical protein OEM49_14855 [Myxococcales bacterium]|nr:hypothetical protein [Myxococcales bacterium]
MSRWYLRPCLLPCAAALLAGSALLGTRPAQARVITGVCPDGSIFIVSRAHDIPCSDAKQVEPGDIPPLNPEFLPRPYGWERFNQQTDPNNPYNLVDAARAGEAQAGAPPAPENSAQEMPQRQSASAIATAPPPVSAALRAAPSAGDALELGLGPNELRDLAGIIEIMQERAPATAVRRDATGNPLLAMRVARSAAFDARLRDALARRGDSAAGPIVLFEASASAPGSFYGNLTFVQGHVAFHPDTADPSQFALLEGRLGDLAAGDAVLGYAVLPSHMDLAQPLDIYWNDLQISATLLP